MTVEERIRQLEERNAELEKKLIAKDHRIAYLEQQLYGRRSEKRLPVNPEALQLSPVPGGDRRSGAASS